MAVHNILGKAGEQRAADYLLSKGYEILARNWHSGHKELDLVATDGQWLIIVEVKTRSSEEWEAPWEAVTPKKIKRVAQAAHHFVRTHGIDLPVRFDIVSVVFKGDECNIEHIEDAYPAPMS